MVVSPERHFFVQLKTFSSDMQELCRELIIIRNSLHDVIHDDVEVLSIPLERTCTAWSVSCDHGNTRFLLLVRGSVLPCKLVAPLLSIGMFSLPNRRASALSSIFSLPLPCRVFDLVDRQVNLATQESHGT